MKVNDLKKKTGLRMVDIANALGVNKVTVTRWNQKGGTIPPLYSEKVKQLLMHPTQPTVKPINKKKTKRPKLAAKKNGQTVEEEWENFYEEAANHLTIEDLILNLYSALKKIHPENGLDELKHAVNKFVKEKMKIE